MVKGIILNSGSNLAALAVRMVITFFLAPILISNLGDHDYGIWEMTMAIIGYMGILDMGLKPTVSRFTALYQGKGDAENSRLLFSSAFAYMSLIGILLFLFCLYFSYNWPHLLAPEGADESEKYGLFIFIIAVQLLFSFPGYVAESTLEGLQKYYIKNILTIIISLLSFAIIAHNINKDNALVLLAALSVGGLVLKFFIYFIVLRVYSSLRLSPFDRTPSLGMIKQLFIFGGKSLIQGIADTVERASDTLMIGFIMGPTAIPYYSIPANLVSYVHAIAMNISHVFMPVFSELSGKKTEIKEIVKIYFGASRIIVAIVLLFTLGVAFWGQAFIRLWIGDDYAKDSFLLILLLLASVVISLLNPLASRYLTSIDKHSIFAKLAPIGALLNIGLSIPLIYLYGAVGAAIGSLLPLLLFQFVYLKACVRELEITVSHYFLETLFPCLMPVLLTSMFFQLIKLNMFVDSFILLFGVAILGGLVYSMSYLLLNRELPECQRALNLFNNLGS